MITPYKICSRCVMDTSASDITFDDYNVCNYCSGFLERSGHILGKDPDQRQQELDAFVAKVKTLGKGKQYDCVMGVSGGIDSSWALVQAKRLGLRPLAVHMDNGWNSELAQSNIANLVRGLGVDLYTHVIDWTEYRNLMQAFFDSDVIDVELLYDNAMLAVNYQQAARHGVKFILAGTNQATEGMPLPKEWTWFKFDKRNIKSIGKRFGDLRLTTFPSIGTLGYIYFEFVRKIRWIAFLDYFDYKQVEVLETLKLEFDYKAYPYKHYESIFTRFYQGYILPKKYKVDKRRVHLGTLVASGQMTREQAILDMKGIAYPSERSLEDDKIYFTKKMGWTLQQLQEYIDRPSKPHLNYPSERFVWDWLVKIYKTFKPDRSKA
ncbi:MAG: N-acetyl sugar amidotransferase [Nitrospina sp.]|jgi:N-acetyl sugar amidotransferase|nr:N-acetyl sugar amidotransferase [Nitrospina sp.]MBT4556327.1 N-acetyl sugar amidotransferase [Nitrospina sp.]MBT5652068.1 N-acetyl sugar amidotransferase [Nitrospina sp.]MBT7681214.1 N-acetyl sugar amidotransferase [Nitrospina sp.]